MRITLSLAFIFFSTSCLGQTKTLKGHYVTSFSEIGFFNFHLNLNENHTYEYEFNGDMSYEFLTGSYSIIDDTLILHLDTNQTYNKITLTDSTRKDTLIVNMGDDYEESRVTRYLIKRNRLVCLTPLDETKIFMVYKKEIHKINPNTKKKIRKLILFDAPFERWRIPSNNK